MEQVRGRRFGPMIRIHRIGLDDVRTVIESVIHRGSKQSGRHSGAPVVRCYNKATDGPKIEAVLRPETCLSEDLGSFQARILGSWFHCAPADRTTIPERQYTGRRTCLER